ncbi:hypothetical protein F4826_004808, partial [Rahnella inusitata]|nr:hypothetical protein [Rahnella inusitata]
VEPHNVVNNGQTTAPITKAQPETQSVDPGRREEVEPHNVVNNGQTTAPITKAQPETQSVDPGRRAEVEPHNVVNNGQTTAPITNAQPEIRSVDSIRRPEVEPHTSVDNGQNTAPVTNIHPETYKAPQSEAFVRPEIQTVFRNRKPDDEVKNETSGMDDTGMHPPTRGEGSSNKIPIAGDRGQTNTKTPK